MYQPRAHRVDDLARNQAFIRDNPLGLLVTGGSGGLMANPMPFLLDSTRGPSGVLRAHIARANPAWKEFGAEALVVFQDPGLYVTPSWYASKRQTHQVVPTWNYVCVQARGVPRIVEDRAWLRDLLDRLTGAHEAAMPDPWKVSDAPAEFIERMMDAIIGIEIEIVSLEGKWKLSQNRGEPDRAGVIAGLRARGDEAAIRMADKTEKASPAGGKRDVE